MRARSTPVCADRRTSNPPLLLESPSPANVAHRRHFFPAIEVSEVSRVSLATLLSSFFLMPRMALRIFLSAQRALVQLSSFFSFFVSDPGILLLTRTPFPSFYDIAVSLLSEHESFYPLISSLKRSFFFNLMAMDPFFSER